MNRLTLIFIIVAAIAVGVYFAFPGKGPDDGANNPGLLETKAYSSDKYGMSFKYPTYYHREERSVGNGEREQYTIVLMEDTEENRALREGRNNAPREGPPTITINVYQNNLDNLSLTDWLTKTNASNFKLSVDGKYSSATISGREAISYQHSGLYETDVVAFRHGDWLIAWSTQYLAPEDAIRKDSEAMRATLILKDPEPAGQ